MQQGSLPWRHYCVSWTEVGTLCSCPHTFPSPVPTGVSALLSAGLSEAQCGRQWLKEEPQSLDCLVCDDRIPTMMLLEQLPGVLCPRFLIICKTNLRVSNVFSTNGRGKRMKGAIHPIPRWDEHGRKWIGANIESMLTACSSQEPCKGGALVLFHKWGNCCFGILSGLSKCAHSMIKKTNKHHIIS